MTPEELAGLHARSFETPRPWSAEEFAELLNSTGVFLCPHDAGFALGRVIADEAELLTLAVVPESRRNGIGRRLLAAFDATATGRGARSAFLEVSADNTAAIALYGSAGYRPSGRRRDYYAAPGGRRIDAMIFTKPLT